MVTKLRFCNVFGLNRPNYVTNCAALAIQIASTLQFF